MEKEKHPGEMNSEWQSSKCSPGLARTKVLARDSLADSMWKTTEYTEYTEKRQSSSVYSVHSVVSLAS
jgi:hypothetical protein